MTGSANSGERDRERARQVALDGLILRGLIGSTVHGLSNPGTDDRDEMGVCVEPPEYVIGLRAFEHYVSRTQPEGVPSGPGDLDLTIYGLRKFCRLALKGSPTVLLLFFVEGEHLLERTGSGERLQALAPAFLRQRPPRRDGRAAHRAPAAPDRRERPAARGRPRARGPVPGGGVPRGLGLRARRSIS